MTNWVTSTPVAPHGRIEAIDVLRGVALFGVMAVNVVTEFRVSFFEQFSAMAPNMTLAAVFADRTVERVLSVGMSLKAFALFSFLFGAGLAIQFERLTANPRRAILLVRRLAALLAFGLAHLFLIWNGDILTEYALAGLIVLPFLWAPRWALAASALAFLALYVIMPLLPPIVAWPKAAWIAEHTAEARRVYGTGSFADVLAFRIREIPAIFPFHVLVFPRTIALFLFGALAWRSGVLRDAAANRRLLLSVAAVGIVVGGWLTLATDSGGQLRWFSFGRLLVPAERLATVVLATGYGAAVLALAGLWPRALSAFAPLGRMAFTNYLAQSVVFGFIFYGYGLGLFGRLGAAAALTIGTGVYVSQMFISAWWLRRYRFGPVEWLWRTLMYGERPAMRLG